MPAALNVVILAAGEGTRLPGTRPKVLMPLWGRAAVRYPVEAALRHGSERVVVVAGRHEEAIAAALSGLDRVVMARQDEPRGTGDAVLAARAALEGVEGPVLILNGDGPLVSPELLDSLIQDHAESGAAVTVVSTELADPGSYGRILRNADGELLAIREAKDASEAELAVDEVNAGLWMVEVPAVFDLLEGLETDNAQGEAYLTDLVERARSAGQKVAAFLWEAPEDLLGFNDAHDLALVRALLRHRILAEHLARGVEIVDPDTTYIDADVAIEPGARILPCTVIEGEVTIAAGCEVGPFSHLRDGTVMEPGSEIGNFTETKKTVLGAGSKAKHLTYLGDARIGSRTNIGAGTITANYDGRHKHPTILGNEVFIGSGTVLVAPATVEDGGITGAGAIVKRGSIVRSDETWIGVPARPLTKKSKTS